MRKETDVDDLFTDIDEIVERYVIPTLGDYVDDYDVMGIAVGISYWDAEYRYGVRYADKAGFRIIPSILSGANPKVYWDIVDSYRKGH